MVLPRVLALGIQQSFVLLIPVVFALAALLANLRLSADLPFASGRFDFAVFAVSHLAGVIGLSLIFHFGFHDGWLSLPYYRTYFVPGSAFALIVIGGEAQRLGGRILGDATAYGGSVLLVLLWLLLPVLPHLEIESGWPLWLSLAVVVAGAAAALQRTAAASVLLVAGVVLLSQCFYDFDKSTHYWILGSATGAGSSRVGCLSRGAVLATVRRWLRSPEADYRILVQRHRKRSLGYCWT